MSDFEMLSIVLKILGIIIAIRLGLTVYRQHLFHYYLNRFPVSGQILHLLFDQPLVPFYHSHNRLQFSSTCDINFIRFINKIHKIIYIGDPPCAI